MDEFRHMVMLTLRKYCDTDCGVCAKCHPDMYNLVRLFGVAQSLMHLGACLNPRCAHVVGVAVLSRQVLIPPCRRTLS